MPDIFAAAERVLSTPLGEVTQEIVCMGQELARAVIALRPSDDVREAYAYRQHNRFAPSDDGRGIPPEECRLLNWSLAALAKLGGT